MHEISFTVIVSDFVTAHLARTCVFLYGIGVKEPAAGS